MRNNKDANNVPTWATQSGASVAVSIQSPKVLIVRAVERMCQLQQGREKQMNENKPERVEFGVIAAKLDICLPNRYYQLNIDKLLTSRQLEGFKLNLVNKEIYAEDVTVKGKIFLPKKIRSYNVSDCGNMINIKSS